MRLVVISANLPINNKKAMIKVYELMHYIGSGMPLNITNKFKAGKEISEGICSQFLHIYFNYCLF